MGDGAHRVVNVRTGDHKMVKRWFVPPDIFDYSFFSHVVSFLLFLPCAEQHDGLIEKQIEDQL